MLDDLLYDAVMWIPRKCCLLMMQGAAMMCDAASSILARIDPHLLVAALDFACCTVFMHA
jgi:hypothetical protein